MSRTVTGYTGEGKARKPIYADQGPARAGGSGSALAAISSVSVDRFGTEADAGTTQAIAVARREVYGRAEHGQMAVKRAERAERARLTEYSKAEEEPMDDVVVAGPEPAVEQAEPSWFEAGELPPGQVAWPPARSSRAAVDTWAAQWVDDPAAAGQVLVTAAVPCGGCAHAEVCALKGALESDATYLEHQQDATVLGNEAFGVGIRVELTCGHYLPRLRVDLRVVDHASPALARLSESMAAAWPVPPTDAPESVSSPAALPTAGDEANAAAQPQGEAGGAEELDQGGGVDTGSGQAGLGPHGSHVGGPTGSNESGSTAEPTISSGPPPVLERALASQERRVLAAVVRAHGDRKTAAVELGTSTQNVDATLRRIGNKGLLPIETIQKLPAGFAKFARVSS